MTYDIKRTNGSVEWLVKTVHPTGTQSKKAMGESVVDMSFTLPVYVDFKINDFVEVYGETYKINLTPSVKKVGKRKFEYQIQFEHLFYDLAKVQLQGLNANNGYLEPVFSIMGNAATIVGLIVENANRHSPGWSVGVVDDTAYQNFPFNAENCLQVLNRLASEFETEFWIENKTIHLQKREQASGLQFEYGQGKGLYSIYRSNKSNTNILTRLYVRGGSRNLPPAYRDYATSLLLPGGLTYIQDDAKVNPQTGYGLIESTIVFENIFPQREGTISGVVAGNDNWDKFTDSSLDFDVNAYKLATPAKVAFNTGQLAGYEFEISDYNHATKQFTIIQNTDEALTVPSNLIRPAVGDKYVLLDIKMPQSYVDAAEAKLLAAAQAYYSKNSDPSLNFAYSVDCDPIWFKQQNVTVVLGNTVVIYDVDLGINGAIRIAGYKRDFQIPSKYELEISDSIGASEIVRQYAQQQRTLQLIESYGLLDINQVRKNVFLNRLSENGGYLLLSGNKISAGFADLALNANHANLADYALDSDKWDGRQFADYLDQPLRKTDAVKFASVVADTVNSTVYVSGFTGSGYRINPDGSAEFDSLSVRKELNINVLNVREITGSGGSVAITNVAKIKDVADHGTYYQCTINTDDNTIAVQLRTNDIVRCQIWDGKKLKYYSAQVAEVSTGAFNLSKASIVGGGVPQPGDTVFQFGNTTDVNRQGLIYLTNSDTGAPYLDVLDGITSDNLAGKTKVRLGKLNGINDADLGQLDGYGIYAERAFIKGKIVVTGGNAATLANVANAKTEAITTATSQAEADAQNKVNIALASANGYTDTKALATISTAQTYADSIATSKANIAQANAISQASVDAQSKANQAKADAALLSQQLVDGIKIGGRNYFKKTTVISIYQLAEGRHSVPTDPYYGDGGIFALGSNSGSLGNIRLNEVINSNGWWTVSGYVNSNASFPLHIDITDVNVSGVSVVADKWTYFEFSANVTNYDAGFSFIDFDFIPWVYFSIKNLKVEQGNKATAWTPAPEDVQAAIDNANALGNAANASYTALTSQLKSMAYTDLDNLEGITTVTKNGVQTIKLDAAYVKANVANIQYLQGLEYDFTQGTVDRLKSRVINALEIVVNGGGATLAYVNNQITAVTTQASADATAKASAAQVAAIQSAANDASAKITALQIGGRNLFSKSLLLNYGTIAGHHVNGTDNPESILVTNGFWAVNSPNGTFEVVRIANVIPENGTYTVSFWVRSNGSPYFRFDVCDSPYYEKQITPNVWERVEFTTTVNNHTASVYNFIDFEFNSYVYLYVKDLKVEKGSKATDWTPAPEDVSNDAQAKANAAQQSATTAAYAQAAYEREIAKAYADGIVSAEEQARIAQASANLQAAKDDAQNKVNIALASANGYTDTKALATISTAQTYADSVATSKANIAQANAISQASVDAQSKANQAKADAALLSQQLVDGIKIGGRNYFKKTTTISGYQIGQARHGIPTDPYYGENGVWSIGSSSGNLGNIRLHEVINSNGWWTVSGYVNSNGSFPLHIDIADVNVSGVSVVADRWTYFEFSANVTNYDATYSFVDFDLIPWVYFSIKNLKIEQGNKATAWTPAPEDVQAAIDNANALGNAANASYTALTSQLKSMAYTDLDNLEGITTVTKNGVQTIKLDAAYVKANIINAQYIAALEIVATKVAATQGFIGGFNIVNQSLIAGSNSDNPGGWDLNSSNIKLYTAYQLYRKIGGTTDQTDEMSVNLGYYPSTSGLQYKDTLVLKNNIRNTAQDYLPPSSLNGSGAIYRQKNRALILEAKNSDENIALEVMSGHVYLRGVNDAGTANALRNGYIKYVNMNGRQVLVLDSNPTELNTGIPDASGLYWNDAQTGYAQHSPCNGYDPQYGSEVGSDHQYTVPAHTYSSTVSKALANSQALTAAQNQAQSDADNYGYCYYQ